MMGLLLSITALVGHFHPVLVHLPIGILLVACCFSGFHGRKNITC